MYHLSTFNYFEDIEVYKNMVKLNTKLRKEIQWIIDGMSIKDYDLSVIVSFY